MMKRSSKGFTLAEFVVAIVFLGVVIGPLLLFVSRIQVLNHSLAQQGRREAWRSFHDQALVAGINPNLAPALAASENPAVPELATLAVSMTETVPQPGLPCVVPIRAVIDATVAEPRIAGAGLQIGAGGEMAPRGDPASPLAPITMPTPTINPADGATLSAFALTPAIPGEPYQLEIHATSGIGVRVHSILHQPVARVSGTTSVRHVVTASDLLNRVHGTAWAEYPGDAAAGDRAVALDDGRVRWLVRTEAGRLQIYEPSQNAPFGYRLDLGAPVVNHEGVELAAGETLAFDFATYTAVGQGTRALRVDFPGRTKAVFGRLWPGASVGFQTTLGSVAGPFSGELRGFFEADQLADWSDVVPLTATPVVPDGAVAQSGTWTFSRVKTPLGVPLLSTAADATGFHAPGQVTFSAPPGPGGAPLGRLSFNGGATVSTGPTLSIAVSP